MPVYDYKCRDHGVFYGLQTIDQHDQPKPCPDCGKLSPRVIVMAPDILTMNKNDKKAAQRNEQAKFEPIHSSSDQRRHDQDHRARCGCDHHKGKSKLFYTAKGDKMFPSMRPWMISH